MDRFGCTCSKALKMTAVILLCSEPHSEGDKGSEEDVDANETNEEYDCAKQNITLSRPCCL